MGACLSMCTASKNQTEEEGQEKLLNGDEKQQEGMEDSQRQQEEEAQRIEIKDDQEEDNNGLRQSEQSTRSVQKVTLSDFAILKVIGEGSFGKVYLVSKKDNKSCLSFSKDKVYAMKMLKKSNLTKDHQKLKTIEEKNIMMNMKSPFIVQLKYAFQTSSKLYFVMDFMQGGEMFLHIRKARIFKEDMARFYVAELILAIEYLHSRNTIYRDLKPENILLGADGHIKICDFGLSKQGIGDFDKTKTICGTPEYLAPEILLGNAHGKDVDWYSLGCVLYEFLSGAPPFYSRDKQQMYQQRVSSEIIKKPQFSDDAWDLLENLLARNPKERISGATSIKQHPFFKSIDWGELAKKEVKPPFVPKFLNETDLRFIANEFQRQQITNTPYTQNIGNSDFDGFTYQEGVSINQTTHQE